MKHNLLGVCQSTSDAAVYGELGRVPLYINRYVQVIKYWFKVIISLENIIVKSVYDNSILNNVRGDSWPFKVKLLLEGFFTFLPSFLVSNNVLQMLFTKNGLRQCHKHILCKPEINLWIRVLLIHYISFYNKTIFD